MAYTTINKPSDYFNTVLYTGNGSTQSITGVNFQPDMVWTKKRSGIDFHAINDAVRGPLKILFPNTINTEDTSTGCLTSFDSDGFTVGSNGGFNQSSETFASWNWLANGAGSSNTDGSITSTVSANTTSGFSIVTWTGDGSASGAKTVGHGLGVAPKFVIAKKRTVANASWWIGSGVSNWNWNTDYLNFSTYGKQSDASGSVFYAAPTSSVINLGSEINASSAAYVAYCFAEVKGFSKFGSYVGNGSADGTFVYTGFKPAFVICKTTTVAGQNWELNDNKRNPYNEAKNTLRPNTSDAEDPTYNTCDLLSNGFKLRTSNDATNQSGGTYIYMAFAEFPIVSSTGTPVTAR